MKSTLVPAVPCSTTGSASGPAARIDAAFEARRRALRVGGAALLGALAIPAADAAQNLPLRQALRYQDAPKGDQRCSGCMHFVPKGPGERGGCKVMPVDSEISPDGWCISWVAAPGAR
jgi:hypothetical protein